MIYDGFIFFNELDVLNIRLNELDCEVDKFILVESTHTFTNIPKPLYYQENKHLFEKFNHKIIHIIYESKLDTNAWNNEHNQRNAIAQGLKEANPDDMVMIGDVDEVPKCDYIAYYNDIHIFSMHQLFAYINLINPQCSICNAGTRILRYKQFTTAEQVRKTNGILIPNAGWHFSALGDANNFVTKLKSFSHTEANKAPWNDEKYVEDTLKKGQYFGIPCSTLPLSELSPWVINNYDKLKYCG